MKFSFEFRDGRVIFATSATPNRTIDNRKCTEAAHKHGAKLTKSSSLSRPPTVRAYGGCQLYKPAHINYASEEINEKMCVRDEVLSHIVIQRRERDRDPTPFQGARSTIN